MRSLVGSARDPAQHPTLSFRSAPMSQIVVQADSLTTEAEFQKLKDRFVAVQCMVRTGRSGSMKHVLL